MMVDLRKYIDQIIEIEDIPLVEEADKAAGCGAFRAAYIMIWIACAESLKRRFREAGRRDGNAGGVSRHIQDMESRHEAVDRKLLDEAKKYGFITDSEYTELMHIYDMRCVYGHPYEQAPSEEQVIHAVAIVVKNVLSKTVKMREGFVAQLLDKMTKEIHYLDDQDNVISDFAREIITKIDKSVFGYMLIKYWKELERISTDATMTVFYHRGIIFTQAVLLASDFEVFTDDEWHNKVCEFPQTLINVFSLPVLYHKVGSKAQDVLVGEIIERSEARPSIIQILEGIEVAECLSQRQKERFHEQIAIMKSSNLYNAKLSLSLCFETVICDLSSRNFYVQNPAVEFISSCGYQQVERLGEIKQCLLGRNILQAAEGGAVKAKSFIRELTQNLSGYSLSFIEGIVLECFTNESNEIRFKSECLNMVLMVLDKLNENERSEIIDKLIGSINIGQPKYSLIMKSELEEVLSLLAEKVWADKVRECLEEKKELLLGNNEL